MTSVADAVGQRISVRAFLPTPGPIRTLAEILEAARRTPSGGNVQPWRIDVLTGAGMRRFKALIADRMRAGVKEAEQYEVYPSPLWEPHRSYRYKIGEDMYATVGIPRDAKPRRLEQVAANYRFFDAPVGLFFSMDRRMNGSAVGPRCRRRPGRDPTIGKGADLPVAFAFL